MRHKRTELQNRRENDYLGLLIGLLKPQWRRFAGAVLLSVLASGASLIQPVIVARIVGGLTNATDILPWALILFALLSLSAVLTGLQTYILNTLGEHVTSSIRSSFAQAVLRLPIWKMESYRRADLVARATADSTVVRQALTDGAGQIIAGTIMFVGAFIAMALVSFTLLMVTIASILLGLVFLAAMSGRMRHASSLVQKDVAKLGVSLDQSLSALKTIRSLEATDWAMTRLDGFIQSAARSGVRFARVAATVTPLSGVLLQISLAIVLGFGAYQVGNGSLAVSQLVAFVMYVFLLLGPVAQGISGVTSLTQASAAAERLAEIQNLSEPRSERTMNYPIEFCRGLPPAAPAEAIVFDDVDFVFPGSEGEGGGVVFGLSKVSFSVPRGARVGIVGPSGAGKSTILNLISGFYSPTSGTVAVQGKHSGPGLIGLVEQDAPVVGGTVRDNLTLGDDQIDDAMCREVLSRVNLEYLYRREQGLDLELSDDGANLSGGERQRLAIARVLLRDCPILLLDESTSHMDSENETKLRAAIADAGGDRTMVVVAHRLSTIVDCDFIIVVREGKIEGIGTHAELVRTSPTYSMFAFQQKL